MKSDYIGQQITRALPLRSILFVLSLWSVLSHSILLTAGQTSVNKDGIYPLTAATGALTVQVLHQSASAYAVDHPAFQFNELYAATSTLGFAALLSGAADLAVTTAPMPPAQRAQNPSYMEFPMIASAIVPSYTLPATVGSAQLIMPMQVICDIERGVVTNWNDTRLQAANPTLIMPDLGITVVHVSIVSSFSEMIVAMCGKIDPAFKAVLPRSLLPAWPTTKYYRHVFATSADVLASSVVDYVGAYALTPWQGSLSIQTNMAAIQTVQGIVVNPSVDSISLNVIELALKPLAPTATSYDLSNPQTPGAWPMCFMVSLTINAVDPVTTCATKAVMMDYLVWFYTSDTMKALANDLRIGIIPQLLLSQNGMLDRLRNGVTCSGQPLISTSTTTGFIEGFTAVAPLLGAYSNYYQSALSAYQYTFAPAIEILAVERVAASEIDLALVNTKQLSDTDVALMTNDRSGVFLPAFYAGVVVTFTLPSIIAAKLFEVE